MRSAVPEEVDPVADLLGRMEKEISRMETSRPEPRLTAEGPDIRSLRDDLALAEQKGAAQLTLFTDAMTRLRTEIPELAERAITARFREAEERFFVQLRATQQRTAEIFLESTQARVGVRIAGLDSTLAEQAVAMAELRERCERSDRNVERLLQGVDRLSGELMRLSALAGAPVTAKRFQPLLQEPAPVFSTPTPETKPQRELVPTRKANRGLLILIPALLLILFAGSVFVGLRLFRKPAAAATANTAFSSTEAQLRQASDFTAEKNYAKAESIYRSVLKTSPENRTAIKELASVLFKQQRYEEAAAALRSLPAEN